MIRLREPAVGRRSALSSLYDSAGLKTIYELIEDACTESENELIGEPPWSESIQAKQAIAHAQNALFVKLKESIEFHVAEARGGKV